MHTQDRVPDGILYTSANLRYRGWKHPVTDMVHRDVGPVSRPDYTHLNPDRTVPKPRGDYNWQRGLTLCWVIPRGHWVATTASGLGNWLASRQVKKELQPRVLKATERCTHQCPQLDPMLDRGRFGTCLTLSVNLSEHSDPRGPTEVHYWGLGYLSNLTEVVEEDVTTEDDTSSDESNSGGAETDTSATGDEEEKVVVKPVFTCTDIRYR